MEEITKVPGEIKQTLELVKRLREKLEANVTTAEEQDGEIRRGHVTALRELASAVGTLSREARSWVGTQEKVITQLSVWQKNKLFMKYFMGLPKNQRIKLYRELFAEERKRPDPVRCRIIKE